MEAHILPRSPTGPRGDGTSGAELASNYLLLCPNHHRVVDERPDIYSVATMRAMKEDHEGRVRARMAEVSRQNRAEAALLRSQCGPHRPVNAWRLGTHGLVVCSFGGDPTLEPSDRWRGSGLVFTAFTATATEILYVSWEVDSDVLYWVRDSTLRIVQHSYDPRAGETVPFIEHTFRFDVTPARISRRLLLAASADAALDLREAEAVLAVHPQDRSAVYEVALFRVRNAGLVDRTGALQVLSRASEQSWCDGAFSEVLSSVRRELEAAAAIQDAV